MASQPCIPKTSFSFIMLLVLIMSIGDKTNPEDSWILILKHLGVTSRRFIMNSRKGCIGLIEPSYGNEYAEISK
jgi:hypothetical protein